MQRRWSLFAFGVVGGLVAGVLVGLVMFAATGQPATGGGWAALLVATTTTFWGFGWLTLVLFSRGPRHTRRSALERLADGDLTVLPEARPGGDRQLQRLALSLRRALFQVQRVTENLHRSSGEVKAQSRALLEAARRQGGATERSENAVASMGESLEGAAKRMQQLEAFARETTSTLQLMTDSIEQVGGALNSLEGTSTRTSERAETMHERAIQVQAAGEMLQGLADRTREAISSAADAIGAVRRRSDETGELALEVTATADRGAALVVDSLKGMQRVDDTVRTTAALVAGLGERSEEIGRVVAAIQEIADQTNLLALNAAIIASQAGESGRAFGVVAASVRTLAERTKSSAKDIAQQVQSVRAAMEQAVTLVTRGRDEAAGGVQLAERAATAIKEIRSIAQRALSAVEATRSETVRLEAQGRAVTEVSRQSDTHLAAVVKLASEQSAHGRELARQVEDMTKVAHEAAQQQAGQAGTGAELSDSVLRLTAAVEEIRVAHGVLTKGEKSISEEVAEVREDAQAVVGIADALARTVEQLGQEAESLDAEVFRFRLPAPVTGGTLTVGLHRSFSFEETKGFDPLYTMDLQITEVSAALASPLLRFEDGALVPDLAESFEADRSARRYRFKLRPGVLFSDGVPLTAHHVKAHFERLLDPALTVPDAPLFHDIAGVGPYVRREARDVSGIEVLDDHTLEFRLEEPRAFFLRLLTFPSAAVTRRENGKLIGTGPFVLREATADRITLERNPTYSRAGLPRLAKVEFHAFPSREASLAAFAKGEVQLVSYLHAEHLRAAGLDAKEAVTVNTPSVWFLGFHALTHPYDDVRVRRALRAGLDVRGLVDQFHPGARVARSLTPPSLLEPERIHEPRSDVALARRLLAEAGHGVLKVSILFPPDRDTREEDTVLFAPLVDAGLVKLEHVEVRDGFWDRLREGQVAIFRGNWIADVADPDNFLYVLLNSKGQHYFNLGYTNTELDRLTNEARVTIDRGLRETLYRKSEALVREDCIVVPLYHERFHAAASPDVQGLRLHQTPPQVRFEEIWLAQ